MCGGGDIPPHISFGGLAVALVKAVSPAVFPRYRLALTWTGPFTVDRWTTMDLAELEGVRVVLPGFPRIAACGAERTTTASAAYAPRAERRT